MKSFLALVVSAALTAACGTAPADTGGTVSATELRPRGATVADLVVQRVVDGDTFIVREGGENVTVRMIGIDTPETVKPNSPVACYGPEASEFAKTVLSGKRVTLEFDASQSEVDKYGRRLAYVWLQQPNGELSFINSELVRQGFAWQKRYAGPYTWEEVFVADENAAKRAELGLWGAC